MHSTDRLTVPPIVRATAEWAWRLVVIALALYLIGQVIFFFEEVVVPTALAVLGAAFLLPFVDWLDRHRVPRSIAVVLSVVLALGVVSGVMTFVVEQFIDGFPLLSSQVTETVDSVRTWLNDGPLHLQLGQIDHASNDFAEFMRRNQEQVTSGALATATTITKILTGALLMIFVMIFFLYGGGQMWKFVTRAVPVSSRERVRAAGTAGFGSLVGYVRATVAVAAVDAVGIGMGLAILQVPLALPLASLVFIGAFIPIVGAFVTGSLAVLVALITKGWIAAVIALAVVVGVMQLESHVLQPFLLGRSVRLHPVAVVLGIAAGIVAWGVIGGLLAVPLIAFLNTAIRSLLAQSHADDDPPTGESPTGDPPDAAVDDEAETTPRLYKAPADGPGETD